MGTALWVVLFSLAGALTASLLACLPGLHVYNVMALAVLALHATGSATGLAPEAVIPFFAGLTVGFAILSTVPSILLAAPDESSLFLVMPGQKYLLRGRGYEGIMLTAAGSLAALWILLLLAGPLAPRFLPAIRRVLGPHMHWIVWCVIAFMLMSEWPKGGNRGPAGWRRLGDAWKATGAGLITFLLAGGLGFMLMYRAPLVPERAFQGLMPAFVGLFTLPWLLLNIVSRLEIPRQSLACDGLRGTLRRDGMACLAPAAQGLLAGTMGGGFAAFFPAITGGVGGLLAGHAAALNDDRSFLVSQGASKLVYYAGGFLCLFVPGLHLTRGGGAALLSSLYVPSSQSEYYMALAATAIGGSAALLLIGPLARGVLFLIGRVGYHKVSMISGAAIITAVAACTGGGGMLVMATATGIGLIPVLFGSRRMNCLGVILLPMALAMSGRSAAVAVALGLL